MPEKRTVEQVRKDIASEREALVREIGGIRHDVAGALPYALGAAVTLAVLTKSKTARSALKILWWLR